jgi:hypothetical protein
VNTADEVFGYIGEDVKLRVVEGVLPQEVYELSTNGGSEELLRAEAKLGGLERAPVVAGLTARQLVVALGFGVVVFASTTGMLFVFAGR